jgi:mannan endo-1,4-beta-mannosidase
MIKDIDYTSVLLKKFQDNKVPILWRPLHEAAGGWFWWGAKGAAPCKKLWQVMYDRMVNVNGLHNLIWVWTHEPNDDAWYPGDEYVDIVGRDIYKDGDHSSQVLEFNDMVDRYGGKKIVTISESGSFPDVDNLITDAAGWSWYMPWYGKYTRDSLYNPLDLWKKMFASDYVITLDEMPNLKTYTNTNDIKSQSKELQVFPTYFDDQITIRTFGSKQTISIYNELGICVTSFQTENNVSVVSTGSYPTGMYLVKIDGINAVKVFKR